MPSASPTEWQTEQVAMAQLRALRVFLASEVKTGRHPNDLTDIRVSKWQVEMLIALIDERLR